jgi:hypothetical protein
VRTNCSQCWKCVLTMMALEAMDKLEAFGEAFDLELYRRDRARLRQDAVDTACEKGPRSAAQSIVDRCTQAGLHLPPPNAELVRAASKWSRKLRGRAQRALKLTGLRA